MITAEELERLRAEEKRDKAQIKTTLIWAVSAALFAAIAISIDLSYTQIYTTYGTIVAKRDVWRKWDRCVIVLATPLGKTSTEDDGKCNQRPWQVGQRMEIAVRIGRLTRQVVVMRDYGVLAEPRYDTLGGLDVFPYHDYKKNPPVPLK